MRSLTLLFLAGLDIAQDPDFEREPLDPRPVVARASQLPGQVRAMRSVSFKAPPGLAARCGRASSPVVYIAIR